MMVKVRLFAVARQRVGRAQIDVAVPTGTCVADLRRAIAAQWPALSELLPHVVFAVNAEYAAEQAAIPPDAEVACLPPVSGG
jgi:molybdopterin converting factor small subunit